MNVYLTIIINCLLIAAFIIDRFFRIKSIKEYQEAKAQVIALKEAQVDQLKQQLELERKNNDVELTEMHKRRYESLKSILSEKEIEIVKSKTILEDLQKSLEEAHEEADLRKKLSETLLSELNRLAKDKHSLEIERKLLLSKVDQDLRTGDLRPKGGRENSVQKNLQQSNGLS